MYSGTQKLNVYYDIGREVIMQHANETFKCVSNIFWQ